jgi:hypothetical protein
MVTVFAWDNLWVRGDGICMEQSVGGWVSVEVLFEPLTSLTY